MNSNLHSYISNHIALDVKEFSQNITWDNVVADLFISNQCHLNCKHCYFGNVKNHSTPMTKQDWMTIIDKFYNLGVRHFHFSGKESSLCKDTLTLMEYVKTKNTYAGIVSNGLGNINYYNNLIDLGVDYIEFSLDGTEYGHDYIRRKGSFQTTIKCIETICKDTRKAQLLNITTCLNKINISQYFDLILLGSKIGVTKFFLTPFYVTGNAENIDQLSVSIEEYSDFIKKTFSFLENNPNLGLRLKFCIPKSYMDQIWDNSPFLKGLIVDYFEHNISPIYKINGNVIELSFLFYDIEYLNNITITNDGYIIPCADDISNGSYVENSLGNIKKLSISELDGMRKSALLTQISKL